MTMDAYLRVKEFKKLEEFVLYFRIRSIARKHVYAEVLSNVKKACSNYISGNNPFFMLDTAVINSVRDETDPHWNDEVWGFDEDVETEAL